MRIALVHYHLGPGGVSRVISSISSALSASGVNQVILIGGLGSDAADQGSVDAGLPVKKVPGLGYAADGLTLDVDDLKERLRLVAREALGGEVDVWHFHNHSLGKNSWMHRLVAALARDGERLLLQIHDLAEQGRPRNYAVIAESKDIYPYGSGIRYAFLNSRDLGVFVQAGLPFDSAILVPNPIPNSGAEQMAQVSRRELLLFAPVRAIRRKNIGELVLLSVYLRSRGKIAISRAPLDRDALAIHDTWKKFAESRNLPIAFDVVDRMRPREDAEMDFDSWIENASHVVTTSVSEGFGLPFLESLVWGLPLIGREIAHIFEDQRAAGIHFDGLYDRLLVPMDWVDPSVLQNHVTVTMERNYRLYGRLLKSNLIDETLLSLTNDGWLDFGNLPESLQQGVIERLDDPANRGIPLVERKGITTALEDWLDERLRDRTLPQVDLTGFESGKIGDLLVSIYQKMLGDSGTLVKFLPPERILDSFLEPEQFHFLQSALPASPRSMKFKAVVCDVYATLLIAPAGGVKPDPEADPMIRRVIEAFGYAPPESPSTELYRAVKEHHRLSGESFPEVDLRTLWRNVLLLPEGADVERLVRAIEDAWHPSTLMPGASEAVKWLSRQGGALGLLSNAQCNTVDSLEGIAPLFAPELRILSYQHGIAKPDGRLFETMVERLAGRGISPEETLFIGNDPVQDITPAAAVGFRTALFIGHPDSLRSGDCSPDIRLTSWADLQDYVSV